MSEQVVERRQNESTGERERSEWANAMNERKRRKLVSDRERERERARERKGERESTKEARRHTGSPRFRDTHACRPAGRPAGERCRLAIRADRAERRRALIDRAFECFSRCQSGDICSRDGTSFRASPPPRTWPRITRKSAIARPPREPAPCGVRKRENERNACTRPRGIERTRARARAR